MNFETVQHLIKSNTAIKLLTADNAPLIISFLFKVFWEDARRLSVPEDEMITLLDDYLFSLNEPVPKYPKTAKNYLADWSDDGFLRKYYDLGDIPLYELTPATETALTWIEGLNKSEFIGTESRLMLLVDILKELSSKTKVDADARIKELQKEKQKIETDIENAKNGLLDMLDETQIQERYFNAGETARRLLSDFRQVEQNFRDIDKGFRKKIITTSQTKGRVLDELFQDQDYLWRTPQGRSFRAFWEFLMSQAKQEELEQLLNEVLSLPAVQKIKASSFPIDRIKNNLVEAGDKVNRSTGSLLEQLRKYVEHISFYENKRIHENIIELLKLVSEADLDITKEDVILEIDAIIKLDLIMGKPLFNPPQKIKFKQAALEEGHATQSNNQLYEQFNVDVQRLKQNIADILKQKSQISLKELVTEYKIEKGMAELIAYVEIAAKDKRHLFNDSMEEEIILKNSKTGKTFLAKIPQIVFCR